MIRRTDSQSEMKRSMRGMIQSANTNDWSPLLNAAGKAPGKFWAEDARCSGMDADLFVVLADGPLKDPEHVRKARGPVLNIALNACADCPLAVAARCLVEALRDDDEYAIRGGLLASERVQLRRRWQRRNVPDAVEAALRGVAVHLTEHERREVVARYAVSPRTYGAECVARGLGVSRTYLAKLAWRYRQQQRAGASQHSSGSADASAA